MPLTDGFVEYCAIIEAGSISAASRELGMSRATLNRHLDALEQRLGTRLLHRSTRKLTPTRAGQELYGRARHIVDDAREATRAVQALDDTPHGLLRISIPPETPTFSRMVLEFAQRYPEVQIEVDASSAHIDLRGQQVDVAIRAGRVRDADLYARRLWHSDASCMASPSYAERRGVPRSLEELAEHDLLLGYDAGLTPVRTWPLLDGGTVRVKGHLVSNSIVMLGQACAAGLGIVLAPPSIVVLHLNGQAPVPVLQDLIGAKGDVSVVWTERQYTQPKVRAFVDHAVAFSKRHPNPLIDSA